MILHIDMDAFYASVEIRDKPELADRPVVVGGAPEGRGVVCAANYVAREYGIHSAQPAATAVRLCPHAVFLQPRMDYYAAISQQIREIFDSYTPLVEPLSLDEAFLDVTGSEALFRASSIEIGKRIKQQIWDDLKLVASVGVAPNKFLAKIASDLEKPNGFVVVDADNVQAFLDPLPIRRIWGVGPKTENTLTLLGIRKVADVCRIGHEALSQQLGESGLHLWRLSQGIDSRDVISECQAKSISHETTFAADISETEVQRAWIVELSDQVGCRLRRKGLKGKTVRLKIRLNDFRTFTRASTLSNPTSVSTEIARSAIDMLETFFSETRTTSSVRLLGVGVAGFDSQSKRQMSLFDEQQHQAESRVDTASDEIRDRFGSSALKRGSSILHNTRHRPQPRPDD